MKPGKRQLPKSREELIALARDQGWTLRKTTGGHDQIISPRGIHVYSGGTPGDNYRGVKIFRAELKRAGLKPLEKERSMIKSIPVNLVKEHVVAAVESIKSARRGEDTRGNVLPAILDAIGKIDRPSGVTAADILPRVMVALPHMTEANLAKNLAYYEIRGKIARVSQGHFRLFKEGETRPAPRKYGKLRVRKQEVGTATPLVASSVTPTQVTEIKIDEFSKALDDALSALSRLGTLLEQYRQIPQEIAKMKQLLDGFKIQG